MLSKIVKELGVRGEAEYPSDRFDIIWLVEHPYKDLVVVGSEGVPGLDENWTGEGDGRGGLGPVVNVDPAGDI